jgi:hypothetical protein
MMGPGSENSDLKNLPDQTPAVNKFDWLNAAQFVFSLLAGLLYLGAAAFSSLVLPLTIPTSELFNLNSQVLSLYLFSAGLGFAALMTFPSIYYSGRKLMGGAPAREGGWVLIARVSAVFPILIALGYLILTGPSWSRIFLPLVHALANGAAVIWILNLSLRKLPGRPPGRIWGFFSSGLTLIPLICFLIEILILFALGLMWMIVIQAQPELRLELLDLADQLQAGDLSPELIQGSLEGIFTLPGMILTGFAYLAIFVPLVEETLKPVLVWFLGSRRLSPREGFLLGAASGAGYALFENLTIGSSVEIWTLVTLTRLGTVALHIFTTGLVGWGITSALTEKKYLRLGASFIAAVTIHGVWNGLNILTALAEMPSLADTLGNFGAYLTGFADLGLVILALGCLGGILRANSFFRRAIMAGINSEE